MVYDTELENLYLAGALVCTVSRRLRNRSRTGWLRHRTSFLRRCQRGWAARLQKKGSPFFAGALRLRCQVEVGVQEPGSRAFLSAQFHGALVRVYVNEVFAGQLLFGDPCEIGPWLHMGQNTIVLELITTGQKLVWDTITRLWNCDVSVRRNTGSRRQRKRDYSERNSMRLSELAWTRSGFHWKLERRPRRKADGNRKCRAE